MGDLFPPYPATSAAVRTAARQTRGAADAVDGVRHSFKRRHRRAIREVEGDIAGRVYDGFVGPVDATAVELLRGGIWAAAQLEVFADAIDVYNETSINPRSIRKLNEAYATATQNKDEDPDLRADLKLEKRVLEAYLDDVALDVAANLDRDPSAHELLALWQAGNLPMSAIGAWAHLDLKLTDLPLGLRDTAITAEALGRLTDQQLVDLLRDPSLSIGIRQTILETQPDAVALLNEQWQLTTAGISNQNPECILNSSGQIVGPDGRLYTILTPGEAPPPLDPNIPILTSPNDFIGDDNGAGPWHTLGSRDGKITYGEPVDLSSKIAFVLAGTALTGKPIGEWQSIGADQEQYVTTYDGVAQVNDGTQPPEPAERPIMGPIPDSHLPYEPWNVGGLPPNNTIDRSFGATWIAINGLEGLNNAQQAEYNRHYSTEVVFQESVDGQLRAVINIYQVQSNGEEVQVGHSYGEVGPDGTIVPVPEAG